MAGGGGEGGGGEAERPVRLDMTAMIDVIFLLLIFFMLGTKFREFEGKLTMQLPLKSQSKAQSVSKPKVPPIIIQVKTTVSTAADGKTVIATGHFKVQGVDVSEENLIKEIGAKKTATDKPEDQPVQIQAARTAHFINILKALDACSSNKLTNVSMEYSGE
jgi:biopolymer transport protein ExbD